MARGDRVTPRWRDILMVMLDAMYAHNYVAMFELCSQLDQEYPDWMFKVHDASLDVGKHKGLYSKSRGVMAVILRLGTHGHAGTYKVLGEGFGVSRERFRQLMKEGFRHLRYRGWRLKKDFLPFEGDLEEDFEDADVRREQRRLALAEAGLL